VESFAIVGQLPFMNDQAGFHGVLAHGVHDFVEGRDHGFEIRLEQFQRQVGSGELAGHRDALAGQFFRLDGPRRHQHGTVPIADAGAAGHQHIFIGHVRICVIGNRGEVVQALDRFAIQRFDVLQDVAKGDLGERTFLVASA
jgi:hypothetical protein